MNKVRVLKHFSNAAQSYNEAASVQHHVGAALIAALPKQRFNRILDVGCGSGLTTAALITSIQAQHIEAQDFSVNLLNEAKKQVALASATFIQADFDVQLGLETPDLIFSNMALHWSQDFSCLLNTIHQRLADDGVLAFSIPLDNTFHEIRSLVNIQTFFTADAVIKLLAHNQFELIHTSTTQQVLRFHSLHEALISIKKTGAQTANQDKAIKLTRNLLKQSPQSLTYDCGLFIARKVC